MPRTPSTELVEVIHDLELAMVACNDFAQSDDFLAGWAAATAAVIRKQLDHVQA